MMIINGSWWSVLYEGIPHFRGQVIRRQGGIIIVAVGRITFDHEKDLRKLCGC